MKIIALQLIGRFLAALTGSSREVAFSLGVKESMSLLKRLYKSNPGYLDKGSCTYYVITDRGGGSLQMITVLHRGSSQMIIILHRGPPNDYSIT